MGEIDSPSSVECLKSLTSRMTSSVVCSRIRAMTVITYPSRIYCQQLREIGVNTCKAIDGHDKKASQEMEVPSCDQIMITRSNFRKTESDGRKSDLESD